MPKVTDRSWKRLPTSQRVVFNYFHGDALSALINAIRLGFQGCETDAYALMRVGLENLTVLQYIIEFALYDKAYLEIENRLKRGKCFSKNFSCNIALKKLNIDDKRARVMGDFSNLGSHTSPSRLAMSRFQIGDNDFPKVGIAVNNPRTKRIIGELATLALFFVEITDDFLKVSLAENGDIFHQRRTELERVYEEFKDRQPLNKNSNSST
jgi:hypothetical protein